MATRTGWVLVSALALSQAAPACVNTDPAVFVDPTIDTPELTLADHPLGTSLTGSFLLTLHLSARASGPSQVSYGTFSVIDDTGTVVVESLPVTASQAAPVTVEAGGADTAVTFTVDTGSDLLPVDVTDKLCAGQVTVSGVLQDSLATTSTPVESAPFDVSGC